MQIHWSGQQIANKFIILIAPPICLLIATLLYSSIWYQSHQENQRILQNYENIQKQLSIYLLDPLILFEYEAIDKLVTTAFDQEGIQYVHVTDDRNTTIYQQGERTPTIHTTTISKHLSTDKEKVFGHLEMGFRQPQYGPLSFRSYYLPISFTLLFLIILVLTLYLSWNKLIAKPLDLLRTTMEKSDGGAEQRLPFSEDNEFGAIACAYNNLLNRVEQHRDELVQRDQLFQMLYHKTPALLLSLDSQRKILRVSHYLCAFLGYSETTLHHSYLDTWLDQSLKGVDDIKKLNGWVLLLKHANGKTSHCLLSLVTEPENTDHFLAVFTDVTAERNAYKKLTLQANRDPLTGLLNQRAFSMQAKTLLSNQLTEYCFAFIDVDHFKGLNDRYGHLVGDEVLKVVAKRLAQQLPDALLSRFGGDEFVMLIQAKSTHLDQRLTTIKDLLQKKITLPSLDLFLTTSIGAAQFPKHAGNYEALTKKADAAMYQAKNMGRNQFFIFNEMLTQSMNRQGYIIEILKAPDLEKHLDIHFQPIMDSNTNRIISAEVLTRLSASIPKFVRLGNLLQVAESHGYISKIDKIARIKALSFLKEWREHNQLAREIDIHLNSSPINFKKQDFADEIIRDMDNYGIPANAIVLEVTESVYMGNSIQPIEQLAKLQHHGLKIAVDDFGTGYSSLSMLTQLPVDILKIDQSFFLGQKQTEKYLIVKHLVAMAQSLNITVVAEGVESQETLEQLHEIGCYLIQGFYYSEALNSTEFYQLLTQTPAGHIERPVIVQTGQS